MRLLTVAETAEMMSVSVGRVRQLCREGRLGHKVGRDWVVTDDEVATFERRPHGRPKKQKEPAP